MNKDNICDFTNSAGTYDEERYRSEADLFIDADFEKKLSLFLKPDKNMSLLDVGT